MSNYRSFRSSQSLVSLKALDLKNKNVLVRVDFNCPIEKGKLTNNYRILETLPTLKLLKKRGAKKITLVTHFGRPDGKYKKEFSLAPVQKELEKLWGDKVFCPPYQSSYKQYSLSIVKPALSLSKGESLVILWENIRFWPEEEKNSVVFSRALVKGQDVFINEAFSASHREHASVVGAAKLLPAYAGLRLAEEVRKIYQLMKHKISPSVAIVGGAKIETKIPVLEALGRNYDQILLGGKVAIEFEEENEKILKLAQIPKPACAGLRTGRQVRDDMVRDDKGGGKWLKKIMLPTGYIGKDKADIDKKSALEFAKSIRKAKKILWNGPMGKFEDKKYRLGSKIIAQAVVKNKKARRLSGGGDTVELLEELKIQNQAGFVSTGGGAMLDYIAYGTLPGIESLKY